jgi:predicted PurR-regulated permease PerM
VLMGIIGLILAIPMLLFIRHELEHLPGMADGPAVVEAKTECVQTVFPPVEK